MDNKTIKQLAVELTVEITSICDSIKGRSVFVNQLLRSCSSVGANAYEAKYAQSKADFISKMEIALKECYETEYWLEILLKVNSLDSSTYYSLTKKCGTIRRKLIASINTVKNGKQEKFNSTETQHNHIAEKNLPQRYEFIYELEKFFNLHEDLLYPSIALTEYNSRKNGKKYTTNDHCKALILSKLSNRQKWHKIEKNLKLFQEIFLNYDCEKILNTQESFFIQKIMQMKCGSQVTKRDFSNLHQNLNMLLLIEKKYGSIDSFLLSEPAHKIVEKLSSEKSEFKMKTIGPALAWEYLRNVGIDGAKPDTHLMRMIAPDRLNLSDNKNLSDDEFFCIMTDIKNNTGKLLIEIDNFMWSYCAEGQAAICSADPVCEKCVIRNYCKKTNNH